jgi:hypothetical protein
VVAQVRSRNAIRVIRDFFKKIFILIEDIAIKRESGCYNMTELGELSSFLEFLRDDMDFEFDVTHFSHRFRLQKLVFFAKSFGWNNDYHYSVYVKGPYSSELADQYYHMARTSETIRSIPLPTFNNERFTTFLSGKDDQWLEAAATVLSMVQSYKSYYRGNALRTNVLERVIDLKDNIPPETIIQSYNDLINIGLISVN